MRKLYFLLFTAILCSTARSQTFGIPETTANNNTPATAQAIPNPAKVRGNIYPNGDVDFYSFTANAGDRVYAAVITSFSANSSTDSELRLFASDGTTVIEFDDNDGTFGASSSSIAGATIPSSGTYYLQVKHFSATSQLRGYDLYLRVQTGAPVPEVESNDTPATANTMPASGWISGARNPAAATEQDWFSVTLNAGETVFISMDLDPERDNVSYNGRLGFALFGDASNQILVVDDANAGSAGNPASEAFVFTAKDAGTYYVFADAASAATGGPTATYNISFTKFAAETGYTNYVSTDVPKTIGPANGSVTSTLTIPGGNVRIKDMTVRLNLNHALMADIDAILTSPEGTQFHLFTDIGAGSVGGQAQMDLFFNDNNGIPPAFTVMRGMGYQPELACKFDILKGMNAAGTWTLTLYDDLNNASGGTLNGWSIEILPDNTPDLTGATTIFNADFESGDNGFTHSGTGDQWARGTPNTVASSTVAAFNTANSGVNCWKTNLTGPYGASTNQTLQSPPIAIPVGPAPKWLSWAMKYHIENTTFDQLVVSVQQVGNPSSNVVLFQWMGATPNGSVGSPAVSLNFPSGWGTHFANVTSFSGQNIEFLVTLTSDASVHLGGVAIDDVKVYNFAPANDDCANAIPLTCGSTATGSTVNASLDGPATSCTGLSVAPDVWYTVVGNGGSIQASLCGSGYDTKIDIYTGTCGALTCVTNNDDFCGLQSQVTWSSTLGTTYYIRVHGFVGATGSYTLSVNCSPSVTINQAPAQPDPTSISPINFEVIFSEPVTGFTGGDVTIGGTAGATTAVVSGGPAIYNVAISGMTGSGTVTASLNANVANSVAASLPNLASTSTDNTVTFLSTPPNDDCVNATPIACGQTLIGTNINANPDVAPFCNAGTVNPGVWYIITGSGFTETISTCAGADFDTKIAVYTGTCGALVCVDGNDDFCGLQSQVSFPTTAGTTYYIFVNGFASTTGTFSITRECCPTLTVNPVANQTLCNGSSTTAVNFSGSVPGTVFTWTNNNTSIGLAASGSGNIPSFVATNPGNTPVTATITVTPTFAGCPDGTPTQFTITVNPTPTGAVVTAPGNLQVIITGNGEWADEITWTLRNNLNAIILSGGPYGFNPPPTPSAIVPANNAPFTFFIEAQGTFNDNSCLWEVRCDGVVVASGCIRGTNNVTACSSVGTLTVSNISGCGTSANQTICTGNSITPITFTGTVAGTVFNWVRDNVGTVTGTIGANGSGTISGTLINPTTVPITVTFTITPVANGCPGTPFFATVTVNPLPTITCPANITVNNAPNQCGAPVTYSATVTGVPAPTLSYTFTGATTGSGSGSGSGSLFNVGVTTVTITATNACGSANCSFTVTVNDVQPPVITCPANIVTGTNPGICGAVVNFNLPAVTDNCPLPGGVTLSQSTNRNLITTNVGIACGAGDNHFWRAYQLALSGPLTITSVRFGVEVNGTAQVATVRVYTSAGAFPGGTRTLVGTATVNLTTAPATFYTANFATPPTVPGNAIVAIEVDVPTGGMWPGANTAGESAPSYISSGTCGVPNPVTLASLGFTSHFIIDLIGTIPVVPPVVQQTAGLPSGSTFPVGTTTNSFIATDAAGNTSTCSFTVTVNDTEQPTITCPANQVRNTDPGQCYATYTPPQPTFADNCGVTRLTYVITQPPGFPVINSPATGINYVPSTQFQLNGTTGVGVTTITYTAADAAGNTRTCSFTVTVNDASIPVISTQPATKFVCAGSDAVFSIVASAGAGNPLTYQWQQWNGSAWVNITGATSATLTVPAVTFAQNTNTYRCVLTGRCSVVNSAAATLFVNPLPVVTLTTSIPPAITPGQSLNIISTVSMGGGTYAWYRNGVLLTSPLQQLPVLSGLTVNDIGTYRLVYTDPNGCVGTSADVVVSGQASDKLWVYPVPNNGRFQVRFYNELNESATIRVFDAKGARVYERAMVTNIAYTQIDVDLGPTMADGVYIVELVNAAGRRVGAKKIIVRKLP